MFGSFYSVGRKMKKNPLYAAYLVSFFFVSAVGYLIGEHIIGYITLFAPWVIGYGMILLSHLFLYVQCNKICNRIIEIILCYLLPSIFLLFVWVNAHLFSEHYPRSFTVLETTKACHRGEYANQRFLRTAERSRFTVSYQEIQMHWYPSRKDFYQYNTGDRIPIMVNKSIFGLEVLTQQPKGVD